MVCVRLTEYDHELSLPLNFLRELSAFAIDELILPAQLVLYYVDGVYSPSGWPPELLSKLQIWLTGSTVSLRPTFQCRSYNFARVYINDVSVAETLVKQGQGCLVDSNKLMLVADQYFRESDKDRRKGVHIFIVFKILFLSYYCTY
jgi:hypothetical protein